VKRKTSIADSLILACFNLWISLSALLLLYTSQSAWIVAVCWVFIPPLLAITLFFWGRDLRRASRRQAVATLLLSIPVISMEIWFFSQLKL
jgi:hypothetical protein